MDEERTAAVNLVLDGNGALEGGVADFEVMEKFGWDRVCILGPHPTEVRKCGPTQHCVHITHVAGFCRVLNI